MRIAHFVVMASCCVALNLAHVVKAHSALLDVSNLPGSACIAAAGGKLVVQDDGAVVNKSSKTVTAICPIERPVGAGVVAKTIAGRIWVIDRHSTLNVCCAAVSKNPNGVIKVGTEVCSSGGQTSTSQSLDVPKVSDGFTFSHYFLRCTIPSISGDAASGILTYRGLQE